MSSPSLPGQEPADDGAAAEETDLQASLTALYRLSTGRSSRTSCPALRTGDPLADTDR